MQKSRLVYAVAGVALFAGTLGMPTVAAAQNSDIHHRVMHRTHHWAGNNDLVVRRRAEREPVAVAPDPFHGPIPIITGPVAIAGTIVSLPFRLVETVFPPSANDPRVLVGAPVYAAQQIAEFPFVAVNTAFGVQPAYYY